MFIIFWWCVDLGLVAGVSIEDVVSFEGVKAVEAEMVFVIIFAELSR